MNVCVKGSMWPAVLRASNTQERLDKCFISACGFTIYHHRPVLTRPVCQVRSHISYQHNEDNTCIVWNWYPDPFPHSFALSCLAVKHLRWYKGDSSSVQTGTQLCNRQDRESNTRPSKPGSTCFIHSPVHLQFGCPSDLLLFLSVIMTVCWLEVPCKTCC